jgi:hypothetical protein
MLREIAWRLTPGLTADRAAHYERGIRADWGLHAMADQFIASHGDHVLHGPFTGLRYWRGGDIPVARS